MWIMLQIMCTVSQIMWTVLDQVDCVLDHANHVLDHVDCLSDHVERLISRFYRASVNAQVCVSDLMVRNKSHEKKLQVKNNSSTDCHTEG